MTIVHHTPAESALLNQFDRRISDLPGDAAVMVKRDEAIERVKAGLPTRRIEAWHYTDLRRLLVAVPPHNPAAAVSARTHPPLVAGSMVLALRNGASRDATDAIEGVTVARVADGLADGSLASQLSLQDSNDLIGALNTAFVDDGYMVDVAAGTVLSAPIEFQNEHAGGQVHVRLAARIGDNAKATIVRRELGDGEALVTCVSNLVIGENSEVTWLMLQGQPDNVTYFSQLNVSIGRNAKLNLLVLNAGGKLVRQEVRVKTAGEGANFRLRGVNLLADDSHTDLTMVMDHTVPHTSSTEIVRNVVTGKARGIFQGRINVHPQAQKTDAKMACNTLLLSDEGEFSAKPELEIFADDVQCGHGATVTEIEKTYLFYLMSRGIEEKTARGLLVKAFVAEVIEDLEDEALVEALEEKLEAWFATHG